MSIAETLASLLDYKLYSRQPPGSLSQPQTVSSEAYELFQCNFTCTADVRIRSVGSCTRINRK
jgi:hypothetical protein